MTNQCTHCCLNLALTTIQPIRRYLVARDRKGKPRPFPHMPRWLPRWVDALHHLVSTAHLLRRSGHAIVRSVISYGKRAPHTPVAPKNAAAMGQTLVKAKWEDAFKLG